MRNLEDLEVDLAGAAFAPLSITVRVVLSVGPFVGFLIWAVVIGALWGGGAAAFLAGAGLGTFVGGGKLVILLGEVADAPLGVLPLTALVVYSDAGTALLLLANMQSLYRLPRVGARLAFAREAGWRVLKQHPWMRRFTWFGLGVFIAVPFQGTGALLGVILGRLLGLSRPAIFSAILIGSAAGSAFVAFAGRALEDKINMVAMDPMLGIITVLLLLLGAYLMGRWLTGQAD